MSDYFKDRERKSLAIRTSKFYKQQQSKRYKKEVMDDTGVDERGYLSISSMEYPPKKELKF